MNHLRSGIGVAARSAQLARTMSEKLLRLHMKTEGQTQKAKIISEALNTKYFHHGYPLSRSEAKEIGLPVAASNPPIEELMRKIWLDIEQELKLREPFSPLNILKNDPACAALFSPVVPGAAQLGVPPAKLTQIGSVMESHRHATRFILEGDILAMRLPDLNLKISVVQHKEGWLDMPIPVTKDAGVSTSKKNSKKPKKDL
jgi:serine dehydrogenase proteinase